MIEIESNGHLVKADLMQLADSLDEELLDQFANDAANIMTEIPRNYIPARHRRQEMQRTTDTATGRLWSGWGERRNVQTNNPASTSLDNLVEIRKSSGSVEVIVGTRVPYAGYVNIGAPRGQGRPEYLFTERGNAQIEYELEKAVQFYADELIGDERLSVGSSIRARGRRRDIRGRFI